MPTFVRSVSRTLRITVATAGLLNAASAFAQSAPSANEAPTATAPVTAPPWLHSESPDAASQPTAPTADPSEASAEAPTPAPVAPRAQPPAPAYTARLVAVVECPTVIVETPPVVVQAPSVQSISRGRRVWSEFGWGVASIAAAGLASYGIGTSLCGGSSGYCSGIAAVGLWVPSAFFMLPAAVTIAGNARRGNGSYGWSLLGTGVGAAAAYGLLSTASGTHESVSALGLTTGGLLAPFAGAILGYELSSVRDRREPQRNEPRYARARTVTISPTASLSSRMDTATVGVTGAF